MKRGIRLDKPFLRVLTSMTGVLHLVRKRWNVGMAKVLAASLVVQLLPVMPAGVSPAQAAGTEPVTVTQQTYGTDKLTDYKWELVTGLNFQPAARHAAAMAYVENAGNVVMFGGKTDSGLMDETWIWDGKQKIWQEMLNLSPKPPKRKGAVMAYDTVSKKVLLFGGEGESGLLGDTWLWDGLTASWQQVGVPGPSARAGAVLAYDGVQLVLFGGYTSAGDPKVINGETWTWDGSSWTQQFPLTSPPPTHSAGMAFDGAQAVMYGGNLGQIRRDHGGTEFTYDDASNRLWKWDGLSKEWTLEPTLAANRFQYDGRWGHAMAYDGRRAVFYGGEFHYVINNGGSFALQKTNKRPINQPWEYLSGWSPVAYGWSHNTWEEWLGNGSQPWAVDKPGSWPGVGSYASMAFDGKNFVLFGGWHEWNKNMGWTWLFGYTPPKPPSIKFIDDPFLIQFDPLHVNDTVNVVTDVYDDGARTIALRGVEYRKAGESEWTDSPYTGSSTGGIGSFTVTLSGLTWQQEYEVRGYAANELGRSYTETKTFVLNDDPSMTPPSVDYDRVGASVLHVKDRKRLVAVGTGITNLLRKPVEGIHYYLEAANGGQRYELSYNVLNGRQLELTWDKTLPDGRYDVLLEHDFYEDYYFRGEDGLLLTSLDFYKPRNFGRVEVPSTSSDNEVNNLVLQGPFTEEPDAPKIYVLNDPSEIVTINESILFKGSRLVVDKSSDSGKSTISGEGRLYVNGGGTAGANLSYTILEGPFTMTSDDFSLALNDGAATDYLNMDMPVKATEVIFVKDGLRLKGDLEIGLKLGNRKVTETVPIEDLLFRYNRFELAGNYTMDDRFTIGPIEAFDTKLAIDSRFPYVGIQSKGRLQDTNITFDLNMKTKQGRLDGISFGVYQKAKLASTGLQVNYVFGNIDNLANQTQIPQKFPVTGSVNDVIVPQLKHPQANYKFNMIGTDSIDMELSSYGFNASGIEYYYWLPVNDMSMQTVVNASKAGLKGFSSPGFTSKGDINVFEVVKGAIGTVSMNGKSMNGVIKGTVHVPKGIPRIGGATVHNVVLSVNESGIFGTMRHNGVGANVKYTFANNTILFEVEAEPPKKKWWEKGLDFMNSVSDFMDAAEPWLELAEELLLSNDGGGDKASRSMVRIAATGEMKRAFDLKPIGLSVQPEDLVRVDVAARMADGKLTTVDQTPLLTTETNPSNGQTTSSFAVDRTFPALFTLNGDQRSAKLTGPTIQGQKQAEPEVYYDAANDITYLQATLTEGAWTLVTEGDSRIGIHETLFANEQLSLDAAAALWSRTPDRSVTALTIEESGAYMLQIGAAQGEVIVYKPDGRPYNLQTAQNEPGWNAFSDSDGNLYVLLDAVEAGTWMISAGTAPSAVLNSVHPEATIQDAADWMQHGEYPTVFQLKRTDNGQAIVEIYGADAQTRLYMPNGERYLLQTDPNRPGMNATYDPGQQKLTVLLTDVKLEGQWKAVGSSYTSIVAYQTSRKFKSVKPLLMEGRYTKYFELPEDGNYMLTVSGGNTDTVIIGPDNQSYALDFAEPSGNAYLQPASDRTADAGANADPLEQTKIETPHPVLDGRDTLYVSLLDAAAGKWTIQNAKKVDLQIQKLIPLPAIKVSAGNEAGAENRIRATWSMEHADSDATVALMLTDRADQEIGEVIAEGLSASGSTTVTLPNSIMPGTYYLSAAGVSEGDAPVYATAEAPVVVTAPYELKAPGTVEAISTGNGEASLRFPAISGNVTTYRIWVNEGADGGEASPIMDLAPQPEAWQQAVISGLPTGATYTFSVSAIGEAQGRFVLSPRSQGVTAELPVPQPAVLTASVVAETAAVKEKTYTAYDGNVETLVLTNGERATLQVASDQNASLTLSINGQPLGNGQVAAGASHSFVLQDLLGVASLKEREYNLLVEAVNERGDRSAEYRKLFVDRTGPLLIASGGDDEDGVPLPLNGTVVPDGKVYITGQTDAGATLTVNGVLVPLDDEGRYTYYAPIDWGTEPDRSVIEMTAADTIGNKTEYKFEVLREAEGALPTYPSDLAALTAGNAKMLAAYAFGTASYEAMAYEDKVRVYAVPMDDAAVVTVNGARVTESGYAEVQVPAAGRTVQVRVQPVSGAGKSYTLQLHATGSPIAALSALELKRTDTGEKLAAPTFMGTEESYTVYADHEVGSITVTPSALKQGTGIKVQSLPVQDGQASQDIPLQVGENVIFVAATSSDGTETREYRIHVWRGASDNAQLSQLGVPTAGAELVGSFHPATLRYQVLVPSEADAISLQPIAEHSDAAIEVAGQPAINGSAVSIPFSEDAKTIEVEVTAQDGTQLTYAVTAIRRQASPVQPPLLSNLQVDTVLDSKFNPYKLKYGSVSKTTGASVTVRASSSDPEAIVTVGDVSLKGGGSFTPVLETIGSHTILVRVESADRTTSQTYSVAVERIRKDDPAPNNVRQTEITGDTGGWVDQVEIIRSRTADGKTIDTVSLSAEKTRAILNKAAQNKDRIARILVTDIPEQPADERVVSLNADVVAMLSEGGMSIQITLPEVQIMLPAASLKNMSKDGKDAYFRVIPIKAAAEQSDVASRVMSAELVRNAAGGNPIAVIGQPVKIETNYADYETELLFPLDRLSLPGDRQAADRILSNLAVYIEHSDGEKALKRGELRYDADGKLLGLAIEISKFSTFTLIQTNAAEVSEALEPYVSGYPDGTFRPAQAITRAELAMILRRTMGSASGVQVAGYPDVAEGHWAAEAIAHMQSAGLMLGDQNGRFRPDDAVTRAEMASIAARLLPSAAEDKVPAGDYSDASSHWASEAIRRASRAGILQGYPDGTFGPDRELNRAEAVKVLNGLFERPTAKVQSSSWPDVPLGHWAAREIESASGLVQIMSDGTVRVMPK